ncbi:MAG: BCCT family transporter [Halieaceae bacterium]|nr:BCCT family transporter [Halieaceae bacterium]
MAPTEHAHCNTDYEPGQDNIQVLGLDIHNPVFVIAAGTITLFVILSLLFIDQAAIAYSEVRLWITTRLDWLFYSAANFFVLLCLFLIVSPFGRIRIGGKTADTHYNYASWFSMMFAAGVGIGLMFYGVLEPVTHTLTPPLGYSAEQALGMPGLGVATSTFHWGLHAWAIYAVMGLALAVFHYNKGLPLTVRSAFYPLLGEKVWGWPGHLIDVLAVFATLFGLATSLGIGAQQTSAGLNYLFGIPNSNTTQVVVIMGITAIALVSVLRGMDKGVKLLSEINMGGAAILLIFVVVTGPTMAIVSGVGSNLVAYLEYLPALSNWVGREDDAFMHDWTTFYWAWWVAWSPFVGMFIARISHGRTVREFLIAALLVPTTVGLIWMTSFGGGAVEQYLQMGSTGVTEVVQNGQIELALFKYLESLPFSTISSALGIVLVIIFFVTSMDSGSLVIDSITAGGKINAPAMQRVFWCTFEGLVAIALLLGGGLGALQAASLATGLPFVIVLLLMCVSLIRGLRSELSTNH